MPIPYACGRLFAFFDCRQIRLPKRRGSAVPTLLGYSAPRTILSPVRSSSEPWNPNSEPSLTNEPASILQCQRLRFSGRERFWSSCRRGRCGLWSWWRKVIIPSGGIMARGMRLTRCFNSPTLLAWRIPPLNTRHGSVRFAICAKQMR